jgi:quercetin dioxygenase-like cupin family protein
MNIVTIPKPECVQKIWGETKLIFGNAQCEVHELQIKEGGYCSRHRHHKWNLFYVLDGELIVELFAEEDGRVTDAPSLDRVLFAGDVFQVAPGQWHRFRADADSRVLEVYWANVEPNDIERLDEGGISQP